MKTNADIAIFVLLFASCAGGRVGENANNRMPDDGTPDVSMSETDMGDGDANTTNPDGGDDGMFGGKAPMTVVNQGTNGFLLHGTVLTPDGPIQGGQVLVIGADIVCVAQDCTTDPDASSATWIATGGIISPGLIDAHNHLPYNFLPEWEGGRLFENRYEWADDPSYEAHVEPFAAYRSSGSHYCPSAKWGELRALVHGTTTMQGQSANQNCIGGGIRNADHEHRLQYDQLRTTIQSPRDIDDEEAENYLASLNEPVEPTTRIAVHMQEGYNGNNVLEEFESYAGRDDRTNRHMGTSLLVNESAVLIHSMALTPAQLDEVAATNSKIVWSPSSNMVLYGRTADISAILQRGITTAIGPDWTVSGEDDMLAEMRYARAWAIQNGVAAITPRKLWEMATNDGATVVGLDGFIGRIEVGYRADIAVFTATQDEPYHAVLDNRAQDIHLVMINGEAYYGPAALRQSIGRNIGCEAIDVCGESKFVCAKDAEFDGGSESVDDVRQRLVDILEGNGFPADEQYGRGDDLLPLFPCE